MVQLNIILDTDPLIDLFPLECSDKAYGVEDRIFTEYKEPALKA